MSRRKFGSSFIVEMTVLFGVTAGPATDAASASRARDAERAAPAERARFALFFRDDAALARAD
jgi:uncharacterized membrane protein